MFVAQLDELLGSLQGQLVGDSQKVRGISIDSRTIEPGTLFVAIEGENFDGHDFISEVKEKGAAAAIVHKPLSVDIPHILVENTQEALLHLGAWWRQHFHIPCIAITGSCGKTTVKELTFAILSCQGKTLATQGNLNNEIGVPLSLFRLEPDLAYAVFEIGASKKGDIQPLVEAVKPDVSVLNNAGAAHIEGFKSLEGVAEAKSEIFSGLESTGTAIINADDNFVDFWRSVASDKNILTFGVKHAADVMATNVEMKPDSVEFQLICPLGQELISLPVPGAHSVMNALAAVAAVIPLGVTLASIKEGLSGYQSVLPGRLKSFKAYGGAEGIDDTYNANLSSVKAAISVLSQSSNKRILVLGDLAECGDKAERIHREIGEWAQEEGVHQVFTIGDLSHFVSDSFGAGSQHCQSFDELVSVLKEHLKDSVTVLVKGSRSASMERVVEAIQLEE